MLRILSICIICILLGFKSGEKPAISYLFYDIPLEKDKYIINDFLKTSTNFTYQTPDSLFNEDGLKVVTTKGNRSLKANPDSTTIELSHTYLERAGVIWSKRYSLNEVTLTMYFRSSVSRDLEFDAIKKELSRLYKELNVVDNGVEYEFKLSRKLYPQVQLTMDNLSKSHPYFTLRYYGLDKSTSH